jgi:hypothetical protein
MDHNTTRLYPAASIDLLYRPLRDWERSLRSAVRHKNTAWLERHVDDLRKLWHNAEALCPDKEHQLEYMVCFAGCELGSAVRAAKPFILDDLAACRRKLGLPVAGESK